MKKEDFNFTVSKGGYMITYKGKSIGGAGTLSGGANLRGRAIINQINSYREDAKREIEHLVSGNGSKRMKDAIAAIDNNKTESNETR